MNVNRRRRARALKVLLAVAVTVALMLTSVGAAGAAGTGPNLNGTWQWQGLRFAFRIDSGTSTEIKGAWIDTVNFFTDGLINGGTIVGGSGYMTGYSSGSGSANINTGWAVTSISGNTMNAFQYWDGFGPTPLPPPSEAACEQLALMDSNYSCRTIVAIRGNPPVQSTLSVAISPKVPPGGLPVGGKLSVPVTVSAADGAVDNISLGNGLTVGGAGAVKVTGKAPAGASGFSLAANQSRTFTYTVTGAKPGQAVLNATASGAGADGSPVTQTATKSFPVAQQALKITIAAEPDTVKLKADEDGKLASRTIKIRVRLANTSKAKLTHVQLLSLNPVPEDPTQQLDQLRFAKDDLPVKVGTLAPGESDVEPLTLKVTGDGTYVVNALALYDDASRTGGNGRAVGQGGKFTVEAPLLYFKASTRNKFVVDGDSWYVTGHVRNLSSFQTLCISPLAPHWQGNAGGLGPHQIGVVPVDDPAPPLAGPLKPGETISFLMRAQTEVGGGSTSAVALKPRATKGDPGDACKVVDADKRTALKSDQIKLAKDSQNFQVRIDKYRSKLGGAGALEFFGGYAKGSYKVLAHLYESGVSLANTYGSPQKLTAALGRGASAALSQLYHVAALDAWFYLEATPAERQQFIDQVVDDFEAKTHSVWDGVQTQVQNSVGTWMESVSNAYFSGDWESLFHTLGEGAGTTLTDSAIQMAEWELAVGLVKKTGAVGKTIARAGSESKVLESLTTVPAGRILNFAEMQRLWGLAYEDYLNFSRIADEEGVLIGIRGRSPISVKNLEEGAVWKHENLKPKNVNDIDVKYLGFDSGDKGLVAFRTYTLEEQHAIAQRIHALRDPAERAAAASRASTRFGEKKYLESIQGFSESGQIDVGFNYADNGLNEASTSRVRGFNLEGEKLTDGGTYYRPYQENPALDGLAGGTGELPSAASKCIRKVLNAVAKLLCRVSGDMDGVYLTDLEGGALTDAKRISVYNRLMAVGWQHPETLTWVKQGLFDFFDKSKILKGLELGGESMMEFAPNNIVRATYLKLADSRLTTAGDYFVAILGGHTSFAGMGAP